MRLTETRYRKYSADGSQKELPSSWHIPGDWSTNQWSWCSMVCPVSLLRVCIGRWKPGYRALFQGLHFDILGKRTFKFCITFGSPGVIHLKVSGTFMPIIWTYPTSQELVVHSQNSFHLIIVQIISGGSVAIQSPKIEFSSQTSIIIIEWQNTEAFVSGSIWAWGAICGQRSDCGLCITLFGQR